MNNKVSKEGLAVGIAAAATMQGHRRKKRGNSNVPTKNAGRNQQKRIERCGLPGKTARRLTIKARKQGLTLAKYLQEAKK